MGSTFVFHLGDPRNPLLNLIPKDLSLVQNYSTYWEQPKDFCFNFISRTL